jgi:hypothetical protein
MATQFSISPSSITAQSADSHPCASSSASFSTVSNPEASFGCRFSSSRCSSPSSVFSLVTRRLLHRVAGPETEIYQQIEARYP